MTLYTIGFCGKSAEHFFTLLREAGVRRVLDTRLSPAGQLSGFAKARDLTYFLTALCGIEYHYLPVLAPPADLLAGYRNKQVAWPAYELIYQRALEDRAAENCVSGDFLDGGCLLCSEDQPARCHRRLAAEYFKVHHPDLAIRHL